jgi:predicted DNA binding protein
MSRYEDAQLLAKKEARTSSDLNGSAVGGVLEALTPRQREVVETAYRCGYFDSPRGASGDDMAELFGFSNAAFHQHVRKAEQRLFEELLEDVDSSLPAMGAINE